MPLVIPSGFKNEPTEEAQQQRIAMLKGTRMLFISGSAVYPSMAGSIQQSLRNARDLGVEVWAVFQKDKPNDNYYAQAKAGNTFDSEIFADMMDDKAPQNIKNALIEALKEKEPQFPFVKYFDGVWSPHESTQPVVGMSSPVCRFFSLCAYAITNHMAVSNLVCTGAFVYMYKFVNAIEKWGKDEVGGCHLRMGVFMANGVIYG